MIEMRCINYFQDKRIEYLITKARLFKILFMVKKGKGLLNLSFASVLNFLGQSVHFFGVFSTVNIVALKIQNRKNKRSRECD